MPGTFMELIFSTSAGGKVCSMPKRTPIFFTATPRSHDDEQEFQWNLADVRGPTYVDNYCTFNPKLAQQEKGGLDAGTPIITKFVIIGT
jgi:hypothetical protein